MQPRSCAPRDKNENKISVVYIFSGKKRNIFPLETHLELSALDNQDTLLHEHLCGAEVSHKCKFLFTTEETDILENSVLASPTREQIAIFFYYAMVNMCATYA